jgi:hypothetical protein
MCTARRLSLLAGILVLLASVPASACGEKFLVHGGGIDSRCVNAPSRTLSILIYGVDAGTATAALARKDVVGTLESVGHKVTICHSDKDCKGTIASGTYDLVLVDAATVRSMKAEASPGGDNKGTVVMPVIMTKSRSEVSSAKKEFGRVVNADDDGLRILPTINRVSASMR